MLSTTTSPWNRDLFIAQRIEFKWLRHKPRDLVAVVYVVVVAASLDGLDVVSMVVGLVDWIGCQLAEFVMDENLFQMHLK